MKNVSIIIKSGVELIVNTLIYYVLITLRAWYRFCCGRFGKRVLRKELRLIWHAFWFGLSIYLFSKFILFPFFSWWDGVVDALNYIIWG